MGLLVLRGDVPDAVLHGGTAVPERLDRVPLRPAAATAPRVSALVLGRRAAHGGRLLARHRQVPSRYLLSPPPFPPPFFYSFTCARYGVHRQV